MPGREGSTAARHALGDEGLVQLCTFRVGGEDYALDIMRVREIITPLPVTPVPRAPSFVEGVVRLRGDVIPILDVRRRLGLPAAPATRKTRVLIVSVAGRRLGLVVDEVAEVLRLPRTAIRPAPALVGGGGRRFFVGVCGGESGTAPGGRRGHGGAGRLRLLLNVKALLDPIAPGEAEELRSEAEATRRT
ncbi:MAG TPA: chemotaxis protein CheW [Anaeromyxobacter sp.]|nr:chemotaxis protein CheW [Anaeromyxobacter sp.]